MLVYALTPKMLPQIRRARDARLKKAPEATRDMMIRLNARLKTAGSAVETYASSAALYSAERDNPSMFVHFDHASLDIKVMSHEGGFGSTEFPSSNPVTLMRFPLVSRSSVHLPDLRDMDRRSLQQKLEAGDKVVGGNLYQVELIGGAEEVVTQQHFPHFVNGLLPMGFQPEQGALLITPLGLDRATPLGFGFTLEYREQGAFSMASIQQARDLSTVFALRIVDSLVRDLGNQTRS